MLVRLKPVQVIPTAQVKQIAPNCSHDYLLMQPTFLSGNVNDAERRVNSLRANQHIFSVAWLEADVRQIDKPSRGSARTSDAITSASTSDAGPAHCFM